jgi:hypothetical protein
MSELSKSLAAIERWRADCNLIDVDLLLDIAEAGAKVSETAWALYRCSENACPKCVPFRRLDAALARLREGG